MPHPKVKISNDIGTTVGVTANNELKVSIDDVNFSGDINVHLTNTTDDVLIYGNDYAGSPANQKLLVDAAGHTTVKQHSTSRTVNVISGFATSSAQLANNHNVVVTSAPTTAVTGTFYQGTQPVSGTLSVNTVDVSALATHAKQLGNNHNVVVTSAPTTAVTGTFYQGTQPISGTVTANAGTGTLAVSNAGLTDLAAAINSDEVDVNIASGGFDGAVTGTFWQGTQPISGTVTANAGTGTLAVSLASVPSHAVTNAGTFAVQAGHNITGGADGLKVVATAGTDLVLGGDVDCKKIDIQAQTDNTGLIAVGFTGVDAAEAAGTGIILKAGDTYSLEITNLNLIFIDATVSGEGVRYTYFT
jgi:hypothetical protein